MESTAPTSPSSVPLLTALVVFVGGLFSMVFVFDVLEAVFLAIPTGAVVGVNAAVIGFIRVARDGAAARLSAWMLAAAGIVVFVSAIGLGVWVFEALSHME